MHVLIHSPCSAVRNAYFDFSFIFYIRVFPVFLLYLYVYFTFQLVTLADLTQTAASTASWTASSASSSHFATWWRRRPRAARARQRPAAAAAAATTWATTATPPVTRTAASWMPAASLQIAWKSVWSAAASASPHREACAGIDQQRVSVGDNWTLDGRMEGNCCCCHFEFSNRQRERVCVCDGEHMCL